MVTGRRSTAAEGGHRTPRVTGFLLINALANAGGVVAFLPLLSLLLPIKIAEIAGEARLDLLTATVIVGALTASASNILFGWLSDRSVVRGGGRRPWLVLGFVLLALSYAAVALASSAAGIIAAIAFFQFAVNALLAPMMAIMAEEIPDAQKGMAGGLLALGNPLAAAVSAVLVGLTLIGEAGRFAIVAAVVGLCVMPLFASHARPIVAGAEGPNDARRLQRDLVIAWTARLLVQIAGNVIAFYIFYYFESVAEGMPQDVLAPRVGQILTLSFLIPLPISVLVGRWSDRIARRKPFLLAAAIIAALGLVGMALAEHWTAAAAAFCLYSTGTLTFLSLHSGFAMELLPDPAHRGRDLGLLNLTNTLPALLGPLLTWLLAAPRDFDAVMLTLAVLTLAGALVILGVRGRR